ncbi:ribosomal protection-like ABC-F family protein [uncultured Ruminococcus sp.]|uniref:ribosomal protection-like ABC-F family protein n=1 Tax=uncultured Ruminococcus sp. TaxID=165186 RepID=UPI0025EC4197|nr:ABC-F type ribosomal protection protein [uncultured Ruminococcus sp.]
MSLINISNLTFAYDGSFDNVFENVNIQLDTDWKLGLTGRNGRGKTTLLRLLMGKYEYKGSISSSVEFEYFPFEVEDESKLTYEVADEICPDYEFWKLARELNYLEVNEEILYRPFNTLSNGERTKVMIALLFIRDNRFLLIDEPTNHLDIEGRRIVSNYLNSKKGFILVSHDRAFLDGCADHIMSINRSDITITKGNFTQWLENKERQDNFELAENEKLKKEIKRLEKTARQKSEWADRSESKKIGFDPTKTEKSISRRAYEGAKSKKMMKRSKQIEQRSYRAVEEKSKLLKNLEREDDLKIAPLEYVKNTLAEFENVAISYGGRTVCSNVSFKIEKGDRIALCGKNGSGKSSVIKLLCGNNINYSGRVSVGSGLVISYVPQETDGLSGNLKDYAQKMNIDESLFKAILRKLDFQRSQFDKNIEDFSGGQKKKVLIAASLCQKAHLYIWDEPLNFIDVISRIQIEKLINKFCPTMIFVEHDAAFCENTANKTVVINND